MNAKRPRVSVSALLVGDYRDSRLLLHDIFQQKGVWRLYEATDRRHALECLERTPIQVVITKSEAVNWSWKRALHDLQAMPHPPQLVVTSRLADDCLWSEALNRGAYDVLSEPFQRGEVERVIASAHRHFQPQFERGSRVYTAAS